jgi:hypothetical protein
MMRTTLTVVVTTILLSVPLSAQRSGNFQDPDRTYDEGWTTLFNGKDL